MSTNSKDPNNVEPTAIPKVTGLTVVTGAETQLLTPDGLDLFTFEPNPRRTFIHIEWDDVGIDALSKYEVMLVPLDELPQEVTRYMVLEQQAYILNDKVHNQYSFYNQKPGVNFRVRVRAVDSSGEIGPWSDYVDVVAGITGSTAPTMTSLTVTPVKGGVEVNWNAVAGGRGYLIFATRGEMPVEPSHTNRVHLFWQGAGLRCFIRADSGDTVKVRAICYDDVGQVSSNYTEGSALVA